MIYPKGYAFKNIPTPVPIIPVVWWANKRLFINARQSQQYCRWAPLCSITQVWMNLEQFNIIFWMQLSLWLNTKWWQFLKDLGIFKGLFCIKLNPTMQYWILIHGHIMIYYMSSVTLNDLSEDGADYYISLAIKKSVTATF